MRNTSFEIMFGVMGVAVIVIAVIMLVKWFEYRSEQKEWLERLEGTSSRIRSKNRERENGIAKMKSLLDDDKEKTGKNAEQVKFALLRDEILTLEIESLAREISRCSNEANYSINRQINVTNLAGGANSLLGLFTIIDKGNYNKRSYNSYCESPRINRQILSDAREYVRRYLPGGNETKALGCSR